jgi:hypothetical protein
MMTAQRAGVTAMGRCGRPIHAEISSDRRDAPTIRACARTGVHTTALLRTKFVLGIAVEKWISQRA